MTENDTNSRQEEPARNVNGTQFEIVLDGKIDHYYSNIYSTTYTIGTFDTSIEILFSRSNFIEFYAKSQIPTPEGPIPAKGQVIVKMPADAALGLARNLLNVIRQFPREFQDALGFPDNGGNEGTK
ncbi:hypothetical protein [Pararhodospirillum oryzae]|uniref:DUF3467 domain-containing protein n=1 Tax=Pararhodospirillum oryzae TaxID=478448 RepID=A0A512HAD6_9PROT|nr:hypothetical protein [Pararhodospirillum oryzae]GEO82416.1 hypothetical protein ROR02_25470 [Pararhodospirillum oryzae]